MVAPYPFVLPDECLPRLWSKVSAPNDNGCRDWTGKPVPSGYGVFAFYDTLGKRRVVRAHNAVWVATNGPFPPGLEPDHTCHRPICVEPEHLEWVTHAVNASRKRRKPPVEKWWSELTDEQIERRERNQKRNIERAMRRKL